MSNKNLLNENTVRRFMKLAEIEPLTDQFVEKINEEKHGEGDKKTPGPISDEALKKMEKGLKRLKTKKGQTNEEIELEEDVLDEDIDLEEANYQDNDDPDGMRMEEGMLDEEIEALLQEMELEEADDYQDDDDDMDPEAEDDDDELAAADLDDPGMEDMDDPDMGGGISAEELADMLVPALKQALGDLAAEDEIEINTDASEKVDVGMKDADMLGEPMEEEIVNEVARRVMNRIINSRR